MYFVDIAGLVKGASKGEGLGNKFLSHIREVDAIIHVVRCFEDENITHVNNKINPVDDVETINTELVLSDIELLEKLKSGLEKQAKKGDKDAKIKISAAEKLLIHLGKGEPAITIENLSIDRASIVLSHWYSKFMLCDRNYISKTSYKTFKCWTFFIEYAIGETHVLLTYNDPRAAYQSLWGS